MATISAIQAVIRSGSDANYACQPVTTNPHKSGTWQHGQWLLGWNIAEAART